MLTDVTGADRAEQCVRDCVRKDIRIGMAFEAEKIGDLDPAQNQFSILAEPVNVVTDSGTRAHSFKSITPFDATIAYLSFISWRGRKSTLPPAVSTKIHPAAMSHKLIPRSI